MIARQLCSHFALFSELPKLRSLRTHNNYMSRMDAAEFCSAKTIESLDMVPLTPGALEAATKFPTLRTFQTAWTHQQSPFDGSSPVLSVKVLKFYVSDPSPGAPVVLQLAATAATFPNLERLVLHRSLDPIANEQVREIQKLRAEKSCWPCLQKITIGDKTWMFDGKVLEWPISAQYLSRDSFV